MFVRCISVHFRKILNIFCFVFFSVQLHKVVTEWLFPVQTTVQIFGKNLEDFNFPVIFKICANPGFNFTALEDAGYSSVFDYFMGQSRFNGSQYGWAGHGNNSVERRSVKGKVQ